MTPEEAKKLLIDLCFRHPALIHEDFGKVDHAEVTCFLFEHLQADPGMQVAAHEGWMDRQVED